MNGKVPNAEATAAALNIIEGTAIHDRPERIAAVRVGGHCGRIYLHLADADGTVIEIDANGWRPCEDPPVRFRKPPGMLPLPMPVRGGRIEELRPFLNLPSDDEFSLVVGFLCGAFSPDGPYPIGVHNGEQGSGKSQTSETVKNVIDPAKVARRGPPRELRDLMIACRNGWVITLDNMATMPVWLSDALCRVSTGGGFSTRTLFTDEDESLFDSKRPVILNGITDFVEAPDLLERSLIYRHPAIRKDQRRRENQFRKDFKTAHPRILGALLDRVSDGLRVEASGGAQEPELPRMADFAAWARACEIGSGEPARFLNAYANNQRSAHELALDSSPLPPVIVKLMQDRDEWAGTPTALLAALEGLISEKEAKSKEWPKASNKLTNALRKLIPDMRRARDLDIDCDGKDENKNRCVRITRTDKSGKGPSPPSRPSPDGKKAGKDSDSGGRLDDGPTVPHRPEPPPKPSECPRDGRVRSGDGSTPVQPSPESAQNTGGNAPGNGGDGKDDTFPDVSGAAPQRAKKRYRPNAYRDVPDLDKEGGAA